MLAERALITCTYTLYLPIVFVQNFERGQVSSFLMNTPEALGTPVFLRVWHDNSGEGHDNDWQLDKVIVVDLQTRNWSVWI